MRKTVFALLSFLVVALIACSSDKHHDEKAMKAAQQYYEYLLAEKYEQFVDATVAHRGVPAQYKKQLVANAKMFVQQQTDNHRGILKVRATGADIDESTRTANVYLVLCFGDSTNEEVVVPMVEQDGVWWMK